MVVVVVMVVVEVVVVMVVVVETNKKFEKFEELYRNTCLSSRINTCL